MSDEVRTGGPGGGAAELGAAEFLELLADQATAVALVQAKWVEAVRDNGDPLMFLEAIPNAHARGFVKSTLIYSWRYADALQLPAGSLDALATGHYPRLVRARQSQREAAGCAAH